MEPYVDYEYYSDIYGGSALPEEDAAKAFKDASRHIDVLTFNRIHSLDELSDMQREIVQECTCRLAEFEYENKELLESVLSSYSINGVSMSFGESWNVKVKDGVACPKDVYSLLRSTGLCCRILRR